jgi:hypothetical protein
MKRIASFALALVLAIPSVAAEPIPKDVLLTENPASYVALGKLLVTMEQTTFKDLTATVRNALNALGQTPHVKDRDRDSSEVCFMDGNIKVHFISGRMAGPDQISEFRIEEGVKPDERCSKLPAAFLPARVGGWLQIGTSRQTVERRFDTPFESQEPVVQYYFAGNIPGYCYEEGALILAALNITYSANRVTHIIGRQVSSC